MARISRRLFLGTVGGAVAGSVCAPSILRAAPPTIRYSTGGGLGPNEIDTLFFTEFMKKNVMKRYGREYTLEVTYTRGTPEAASLLAARSVDIAAQSCASFVTAISRNAVPGGMKAIADEHDARPGFSAHSFYVMDNSAIRSPADLKGKTIAINAFGAGPQLLLQVVLRKHGLDPKRDVRMVEISFPAIGPALREGRVDCGVMPIPFGATEEAKGGIRELFKGTDAFPAYSVIFQVATNEILATRPDAVRAWLADFVDGLHWLYDPANRKEAVALAAEASKSPVEVVDSYFLTNRDYYRNLNACLAPDLLQAQADGMVSEGFLPAAMDIRPHLDTSYLPNPC